MSSSTHELCPKCESDETQEATSSSRDATEMKKVSSDSSRGSRSTDPNRSGEGSTDINLVLPTSSASTSSSESVCRICQTGTKETNERLQSAACNCRGNISRVHESCLRQWVRYKGSAKCEICTANFEGIVPPTNPGVLQLEALRQLTWHLDRTRPFNRRKRAAIGATIIFLLVVTCVTSLLTVSADREYRHVTSKSWYSQEKLYESEVVFSICIAFSFFCATLTVGLLVIWLGMECCYVMNRRAVIRQATHRLFNEQQRA